MFLLYFFGFEFGPNSTVILSEILSLVYPSAAARAGERSRALLRGEENPAEEASMLFLVAQVGWFADVFFFF